MIQEAIQFHKTISAWFGEGGKPVPQEQAQARANVCLKCPLNVSKPIWELLAEPAALIVRRQIELKSNMNLTVAGEDDLKTCSACNCMLKLKVWQPLKFIEQNMTPAIIGRLDRSCFILDEMF